MTQTPVSPPAAPPTPAHPHRRMGPLVWKAGIPLLLVVAGFVLPTPGGVDPHGMAMLGIFVGTIVGLILQPLPTGSVALVGLAAAMISGTQAPSDAQLHDLAHRRLVLHRGGLPGHRSG